MLAFCERHNLGDHGAPFDVEVCLWFLREEDELARAKAAGRRTGASVKYALACSLRWLRHTLLIPFEAELQPVRKAFGRVGLAPLALLRVRQRGVVAASCVAGHLRDCLEALRITLRLIPSFRVPVLPDCRSPIVIFTDASWESSHSWLGFVFCYYPS